ncbi:MAG TPA: helix-turn-helix transcriptional regulator [Bacteroidales bacterium]|jgi:transcriptional regulator with XRE-family HTH domain|nr:helix-turn-helix domain-containing protein [Bacteroidales bacterium]HNT93850.1 helix-turn-helix transcriptional regulator [Bacteroidales bacterium]HRW26767.1 helix-turn-helix transcriptional regulator [Bacteroidales bacterium]
MKTFADFIREKRIAAGLTLREFCRLTGFDASNWSKIERNLLPPPQSRSVLESIASVLSIVPDSQVYKELMDLAALSSVPEDLIEPEILEQLPVFFRTVRGEKPTEEELKTLINKIRSAWTREK